MPSNRNIVSTEISIPLQKLRLSTSTCQSMAVLNNMTSQTKSSSRLQELLEEVRRKQNILRMLKEESLKKDEIIKNQVKDLVRLKRLRMETAK